MPGYISEFQYYGDTSQEFIEVALPEGTDPSGYSVYIYDAFGNALYSFPLGTATDTVASYDVYVIDSSTLGFDDGGADPTGNLYPDDGIALVDDTGTTIQFISYWGNTVTAVDGPAAGLTSTDVGTAGVGESLQSDDRGSTYYVQPITNAGTIPACYGAGTLIATPAGPCPIEQLQPGDHVTGEAGEPLRIRLIRHNVQSFDTCRLDQRPVRIAPHAFGRDRPFQPLILSSQHRVVLGGHGQLEGGGHSPCFVPAKALTELKRVRFMAGRRKMDWYHILLDRHAVIWANGVASESLLLGPSMLADYSPAQMRRLSNASQRPLSSLKTDRPAYPCLSLRQSRTLIAGFKMQGNRRQGQAPGKVSRSSSVLAQSMAQGPKGCKSENSAFPVSVR